MTLTVLGWGFLVAAWSGVGGLTAWCMVRLLRAEGGRGGPEG